MEAVMPELQYTEQQLKTAFYHNVICTRGTKRLVATSEMQGASTGKASPMLIFVPDEHSEYDLVLSLCQDGTQRITVDWDDSAPVHDPLACIYRYAEKMKQWCAPSAWPITKYAIATVTPSTDNWHLWGNTPVTWTEVVTALKAVNNDGYLTMNQGKGFCGLRPPWRLKDDLLWENSMDIRFDNDLDKAFAGFDWSQAGDRTPPPPPGVTLDDLFGEDQ
jgi:hypothetical protein